ncbi:MAG: cytochrome c [Cyclobacteriaceae bacterium]|nr:cytochrome c [Cyclobacteriaceae bacterium]
MKLTSILFLLVAISLLSFDQAFDLKASMERGKSIYEAQCITCHMAEGEGIPGVFPPLAKAEYLADKNRLVKVVLQGVRGEMNINGTDYNGEMTGFSLSDQETADVLNYICNTWGNKAATIKPADIQPALKAASKNYQPY